mmetsp:Transcript_23644/g.67859  ORF Transcript_23644/g.67859 Transcript_23644/m.67859 type:complete len:250 (+) Transcript_23644:949-1698(+)
MCEPPKSPSAARVRQPERVRENGLTVRQEGFRCLLAVRQGIGGEEASLKRVEQQPTQVPASIGQGAMHDRAGEHVRLRLPLAGDRAIENLGQGQLMDIDAQQQLAEVRRQALENSSTILDRLHCTRRARHEKFPVQGGVEAAQGARTVVGSSAAVLRFGPQLLDNPLTSLDMPPRRRTCLVVDATFSREGRERHHVIAHPLHPARGAGSWRRAGLAALFREGLPVPRERLEDLGRLRGESATGVEVHAE